MSEAALPKDRPKSDKLYGAIFALHLVASQATRHIFPALVSVFHHKSF